MNLNNNLKQRIDNYFAAKSAKEIYNILKSYGLKDISNNKQKTYKKNK